MPPYQIMEHVPLAVFTNGALTALNELRHCALLGLGKPAAGWVAVMSLGLTFHTKVLYMSFSLWLCMRLWWLRLLQCLSLCWLLHPPVSVAASTISSQYHALCFNLLVSLELPCNPFYLNLRVEHAPVGACAHSSLQ